VATDDVLHDEPMALVGAPGRAAKIGILVVAYNAATTLASVLDRVPEAFRPRITQIFVCDDASDDSTYLVGLGYQQVFPDLPLTIIRNPRNLGYGGNQKAGYRLAIEHELDIIVLLHGDGQYAPECLEEIVAPLERGECDAVFGSRMMIKGSARAGGMPLYKFVGNKILTRLENSVLGTTLSEFHSGYRAYSVRALSSIPFERNSDDFNFDTQIIIQLVDAGMRIREVPIPTFYGDEISYVNGMRYAKDITFDVLRYRAAKLGFLSDDLHLIDEGTTPSAVEEETSHAVILRWLSQMPPARVLSVGRSGGLLATRLQALGHHVTAVDAARLTDSGHGVERFVLADLDHPLPREIVELEPFDVIVAADVIEHLRQPERLLNELRRCLGHRGALIASVPNFGHWYVRARTVLGAFDYDNRGVLDRNHLRFFTSRSFTRLLHDSGFSVLRQEATGLPLDVLAGGRRRGLGAMRRVDRLGVSLRPSLFGYQLVCQCDVTHSPDVITAN
jgi:glycosyltransferase involved in cell wall biosynthesis